nr:MAG: replication initiation protein [Microvirus sp.]
MACDSPITIEIKGRINKIPVACGKCPPCKFRRINDWVFRLKQEDKNSTSSCFITLTYDTKHVPISDNGFMSLRKRDWQLFMKRLRKQSPNKLKYYACGEYGSTTKRPHYHAILFNCTDSDLIDQAWGLGSIHIGTATGDSMAYCLKYINKQAIIPQHKRDDRQKEFSAQSKNLGSSYLTPAVSAFHRSHPNDLRVQNDNYKIAMPKYYRYKIFSPAERIAQLPAIRNGVTLLNTESELRFDKLGYTQHFDDYKFNRKLGRHKSHYSSTNQKRDKI